MSKTLDYENHKEIAHEFINSRYGGLLRAVMEDNDNPKNNEDGYKFITAEFIDMAISEFVSGFQYTGNLKGNPDFYCDLLGVYAESKGVKNWYTKSKQLRKSINVILRNSHPGSDGKIKDYTNTPKFLITYDKSSGSFGVLNYQILLDLCDNQNLGKKKKDKTVKVDLKDFTIYNLPGRQSIPKLESIAVTINNLMKQMFIDLKNGF